MSESDTQKAKSCKYGLCLREVEAGTVFCSHHAGSDPNGFPVLGCVLTLAIIGLAVWAAFTYFRGGSNSADGTVSEGLPDAASASVTRYAGLAQDAEAYFGDNFSETAEYAVVQSLQVKSGVLWINTSLFPGDMRSGTAVCGLGSAWAYSDPEAVAANIWGVSVRASGGQKLVQRDGFADDCQ